MTEQPGPEALFGKPLIDPSRKMESQVPRQETTKERADLFLWLLSGRKEPLTDIEVRAKGGVKRVSFPPTDQSLVEKDGDIFWLEKAQIKKNTHLIQPGSLAAKFDTVAITTCQRSVFGQLAEKGIKEEDLHYLKSKSGQLMAVIAPGDPGSLWTKKGEVWQEIDLIEDKGIEGKVVLVDHHLKPEDWPQLVFEIKKQTEGLKSNWIGDIAVKFALSEKKISEYQQIVSTLTTADFDQDYLPKESDLNQMKLLLANIRLQVRSINQLTLAALPQSEQKQLESQVGQALNSQEGRKAIENFLAFSKKDLASRLYRLGVKEESIKRLMLRADEAILTKRKRVKQGRAARAIQRYGAMIMEAIFKPTSQYFACVEQLKTSLHPEKQIINILTSEAQKTLLAHLDIPQPLKNRLQKELEQGLDPQLPKSVTEWLEQQTFKEALGQERKKLHQIQSEASALPNEQRKQYLESRVSWEEKLSPNLNERKDDQWDKYDCYPILTDKFNNNWEEFKTQNPQIPGHLLNLLEKEAKQKYRLAQAEKKTVQAILDFQRQGEGYAGWIEGWKKTLFHFLESTPSRTIIDEELNCIGRQGLMLAILGQLGFENQIYTANTYHHGFLMIEDSFGLGLVVEPSGDPVESHYFRQEKEKGLYYLSRKTKTEPAQETIKIAGEPEQINIVFGALNWQLSTLKSWLININLENEVKLALVDDLIKLNERDGGLWDLRAALSPRRSHPDYLYSSLRALELNSWHCASFARLVLQGRAVDHQIEAIKKKNWGDKFSSAELERMKEITDEIIKQLTIPLDENDEQNVRSQIKKRAGQLDWTEEISKWSDLDFDLAVGKLKQLSSGLGGLLVVRQDPTFHTT